MNNERLEHYLIKAGFDTRSVESNTEIVISCPLCFDERPRLYISAEHGGWLCFHCQEKGSLWDLLIKVCTFERKNAAAALKEIRGAPTGSMRAPPRTVTRTEQAPAPPVELPPGFNYLQSITSQFGWSYCKNRGLSDDVISLFVGQLRVANDNDILRGRVIIPVYTHDQLRTWVARTWFNNAQPKVYYPAGSQTRSALFPYDYMMERDVLQEGIVLVEGVFDALRLMTLDPELRVLATLGAHITPEQMILLKQTGYKRVTLMRDNDDAGRKATLEEVPKLRQEGFGVDVAVLEAGTDPGDLNSRGLFEAFRIVKRLDRINCFGATQLKEEIYD